MDKVKEKLKSAIQFAQICIESDWFIYVVGLLVTIFSVAGLDFVGLSVMIALICIVFLTKIRIRSFLPPLIMLIYCLSAKNTPLKDISYFMQTGHLVLIGVLAVCLAGSIVYAFIKRSPKFKITANFWGFMAISAAFIFGGVFFKGYNPVSILIGIVLALCFLGSYCLFNAFIKKSDFRYIAKIIITASLVVCAQLLHLYAVNDALRETFEKNLIILGWGISNAIAVMILVGMPFAIYFMATSKYSALFFLVLAIQSICVFFTYSRGALVVAAPLAVAGSVYSVIRNKGVGRLQLAIVAAVGISAIGVFLISNWEKFVQIIAFYLETGLDDRGRSELIMRAMEKFYAAPIFGVGIMEGFQEVGILLTLYHNTFFQFLAWSGIVGFICYVVHCIIILMTILKKPNEKRTFLGVAILTIFIHSLFDCVIYYPYLTFMYTLFIAVADNDLDTLQNDELLIVNTPSHKQITIEDKEAKAVKLT